MAEHGEVGHTGRFVLVTWAAGGNVAPAASLARVLSDRGHDVRILGPQVLRERFESVGYTFRPFARAHEPGRMDIDVFDDHLLGWTRYITGSRLADDVAEELARRSVDAVVVDAFLSAGLAAAEQPHSPPPPSCTSSTGRRWRGRRLHSGTRRGPLVDATRAHLGLPPLPSGSPLLRTVWGKADLALACTPEEFDHPLEDRPANVRYVGPILDRPPDVRSELPRSLVVVSFSTTNMDRARYCSGSSTPVRPSTSTWCARSGGIGVEGLRIPGNATVHEWLPHRELLARTSAVVTHAGLSTVMHALANGVPTVCLPMGRDQPYNAERVATLELGLDLEVGSSVEEIQAAVVDVLGD